MVKLHAVQVPKPSRYACLKIIQVSLVQAVKTRLPTLTCVSYYTRIINWLALTNSTGGNITVSATNCTVDFFSFSHMHSSCSTGETAGTTVTMWQLFVITLPVGYECNEDSTCMLSLAAMWSRTFPLEPDKHSQALTSTVRREEMEHKVIVNVSLTLFSISNQPDTDPDYSVILSVSNCSGLSLEAGKFRLEVLEPQCAHDVPTPTQNFSTLTVTESAQCPKVNASFIGGRRDSGLYTFQWLDASNRDLCFCSSTTCIRGRYTCGWFVNDRNTCNHTAWLIIGNCTTSDAGNYTVQAFGADDSIGPPARVLLCKLLSSVNTVIHNHTSCACVYANSKDQFTPLHTCLKHLHSSVVLVCYLL